MQAREPQGSAPTLACSIELYVDFLAHEQHAARSTITGYKSHLNRFARWIFERYKRELTIAELSIADVRDYLYDLSREGLRPRTLRGALYPVRGMLALAVERGHRIDNPALAVRLPKKGAAERMTVSDAEIAQLLAGVEREPNLFDRTMNRAVLAVLVYTAIRRQELLDLELRDVELDEKRLTVRSGKGSKRRVVPLSQPCVDALSAWIEMRKTLSCKSAALFVADRRRRLGDEGLMNIIDRVRCMADLRDAKHVTPHAIRHAAASRMLKRGGDLKSIQQILGHTNLQTTAAYLHTDQQQLQRVVELGALEQTGKVSGEEKGRAERNSSARPSRFRRVERGRRSR